MHLRQLLAINFLLTFASPVGIHQFVAPAAGNDQEATLLAHLKGSWSGEGTLLGRPAHFSMEWRSGPTPDVYSLAFSNGFEASDAEREPLLRANALYRVHGPGTIEGVWYDDRGMRLELTGTSDGQTMRVKWSSDTETGVTTYHLMDQHHVSAVDSVRAPDGMRIFGQARYTRMDHGSAGDASGEGELAADLLLARWEVSINHVLNDDVGHDMRTRGTN